MLKYPDFFNQNDITKEDFLWSYGFIITRCFECIEDLTFLIPHADMFNHGIYHYHYYHILFLFTYELLYPEFIAATMEENIFLKEDKLF